MFYGWILGNLGKMTLLSSSSDTLRLQFRHAAWCSGGEPDAEKGFVLGLPSLKVGLLRLAMYVGAR